MPSEYGKRFLRLVRCCQYAARLRGSQNLSRFRLEREIVYAPERAIEVRNLYGVSVHTAHNDCDYMMIKKQR